MSRPSEGFCRRSGRSDGPADALFVADCLADCSSEHDTGVLDRVVAVYIKISVYRNGKVEKTVAGKAVEHMVKKADAGVDVALSRSIQI